MELKQRNPGGGGLKKPKVKLPREADAVTIPFDEEAGLSAAIRRLRSAEIQANKDYQLSLTTGDASLITQQKKNWLDLVEQLRKVEQSTPDIQRMNQQTLDVADVEREVARMCNAFRVALEALPRSLPQKLTGLDPAGMEAILKQSMNDALSQLHTEKWNMEGTDK